ncbi:hypothetical protein D3C76_1102020 [compost metagenome]
MLVSLSSPAATLVILFGPVPPWLALKAPAVVSHSNASLLRPVIWSPMVVISPSTLVTRLSMPATVSLVAFSWLPLTASVLVSLSSPAATLVILFGPVPPWLALNAPTPASHSKASLLRLVTWSPIVVTRPSILVT